MSSGKKNKVLGGEMLARAIAEEGIEFVFGIPGGEFLPFLEAVTRCELGIAYIGVRHEQAAGYMADAVARVTGKAAVACATVGPGLTDLLPGVDAAWADNVPMLVVHPAQDKKFEDHHRLQDGIDQLTLMRPIVKYQKHVDNPNRVVWAAQKCFREMYCGRPNPVQLEVREDALYGEVEDYGQITYPPYKYRNVEPPAGNPKLIKQACELLTSAKKPLIVSGGGVTQSGAWETLRKLSLEYGIPCGTTFRGIGTVSSNLETYIGATVGTGGMLQAARQADLVLALGTKFSYTMGYGKPPVWNPDASLVQVDVDPLMIGKNRPVTVGILGDLRVVLEQIYNHLLVQDYPKGLKMDKDWLPSLRQAREDNINAVKNEMTSDKVPILPHRLAHDLLEFMEPEDILVLDGGDIVNFTLSQIDYAKPRGPRTVLHSTGFGHLGTAIPYAIGAKLAAPERRVFFITGDGSFLFLVGELDTAVRYKVPFVGVVADNQSWGMIKNKEKRVWGRRHGSFCVDLPNDETCSNYVKIAEGFGCHAERVEDPAEIKPALQRAVDSNRPAIVVVPIKFMEPANASLLASLRQLKF
ncbi:MAG: thiamine pyrophosphate-binding protein [Promethearchaeota archaeon]